MKRMNGLAIAVLLGGANAVFAANGGTSIALNFGAGEPNGAEEAVVEGAAGTAGTKNWNNLYGNEGFGDEEIFLDVGGVETASGVTVEWTSNNTWSTDGRGEDTNDAPEGNDRALMLGYLDTTDTSVTEILINDIPAGLAAGYDVFVYVQNGVLNRGGTYTVSGSNGSFEQSNVTVNPFDGAYVGGEEGNYLVFPNVTGSDLRIEAMATDAAAFRGPVNAIEICEVGKCVALPNAVAGRDTIGSVAVPGSRSNIVFGPAENEGPGLAQEWFAVANPGNKAGIDDVFDNNTPVVPAFRGANGTWWTGSDAPFGELEKYPAEIDPPLENNYSVRLTGEILIEESGTYRFADGIDDYTYLAIDIDKSGVAGDSAEEVIIDDNAWTNVFRTGNNGGMGLGEADITVADGGEWLAIEVNAAEGGGGDSGVLYWDFTPGVGVGAGEGFPEFPEDPIFEDEAAALLVPESHLRSSTRPLVSADINGTIPESPGGWEFEINATDGTSDMFSLANPDSNVFTTSIDVDGATFLLSVTGDVSPGDSFQIIAA
ncbi:MAG: hypothetical protein KDB27_06845, partial [Planctomycetales bacterium]|nr:hypothetical protein [Planctomycetales bacterium]